MEYDDSYAAQPALFGDEPDDWLVRHAERIARRGRVLDVGAGQGRHAIHLASMGVHVDALDPSQVGLDQLALVAAERHLPIRTLVGRWEDWAPPPAAYDAVLLFGLIPLLEYRQVAELADRLWSWVKPGGLVFVTAHTTEDAGHALRAAATSGWVEVEPGSFRSDAGEVRTWLRPGQLPLLFAAFEVLEAEESLGPEHRHGDGPPERHARALGLFRRP